MSNAQVSLPGASVWEAETYRQLAAHAGAEAEIMDRYGRFAKESPSEVVRYLVRMILEDERRHHQVLFELSNSLRAQALLENAEPRVPALVPVSSDPDLKARTREFIGIERRDLAEIKALIRRVRSGGQNDLWLFLLKQMRDDTRRHIRVLKFIEKRAGRPRRSVVAPG